MERIRITRRSALGSFVGPLAAPFAVKTSGSRDAAVAASNAYINKSVGEASTVNGDLFSYLNRDGYVVLAQRQNRGSSPLDLFLEGDNVRIPGGGHVSQAIAAGGNSMDILALNEELRTGALLRSLDGHAYRVVASGGHIQTASGHNLEVLPDGNGNYQAAAFGMAPGDEKIDAGAAITKAIRAATTIYKGTGAFAAVVIPAGNYAAQTLIDRTGNGNYVNIVGAGIRNSILTATASMESMLDLAEDGEIAGRTLISGVTFDCANRANRGVDAEQMRYWTVQDCEVRNAAVEGIKCGNWITTVDSCLINGCAIGLTVDGIDASPQAANNLRLLNSNFTSCPIGMVIERESNDVTLDGMSFDHCENVGLWVKNGARSLNITNSYFERAGRKLNDRNGNGVPVKTIKGEKRTMAAPIIINHDPSAIRGTSISGTMQRNFFANCNNKRAIVLSNVKDFVTRENRIHEKYQVRNFVQLVGPGCNNMCVRLEIEEAFSKDVVGKLLATNGAYGISSNQNIRISNLSKAVNSRGNPLVKWNDIMAVCGGQNVWAGIGRSTTTQAMHEGRLLTRFSGRNPNRLILDLESDSPIKGSYLRIHGASRGEKKTSNAVDLNISVDQGDGRGLVQIAEMKRLSTFFKEFGRASVIYIPHATIRIQILVGALYDDAAVEMVDFAICDAAFSLDEPPLL